ncbi:MAG: hypothetical protein ACT6U0_09130 [Shinella sp.]|uniref:hypothetical protein n=1 Tax=Shinella sp. TaxID=1870904 RepID=UPI004035BB91
MLNASTIGPNIMAELDRHRSGPKISDFSNWRTPPASAVRTLDELPPEARESVGRAIENAKRVRAGLHLIPPDRSKDFTDTKIREAIGKADITALSDEQVEQQIELFAHVRHSGRTEEFAFFGKNGDQTTTSMTQFIIWLQERRDAETDDGTYSPNVSKA